MIIKPRTNAEMNNADFIGHKEAMRRMNNASNARKKQSKLAKQAEAIKSNVEKPKYKKFSNSRDVDWRHHGDVADAFASSKNFKTSGR